MDRARAAALAIALPLLVMPAGACGTEPESVDVRIADGEGRPIGDARLTEANGGVRIHVRVQDLPAGPKGFHIHETGRCDPPDFQSAGGHLAPHGREHGLENPAGPHAGDLPNLEIGPDGRADLTFVTPRVTLADAPTSLLRPGGTALVIHERADDQRTDPSGDSGARIACGVIAPR